MDGLTKARREEKRGVPVQQQPEEQKVLSTHTHSKRRKTIVELASLSQALQILS